MTNCKPGDLAVIVEATNRANIGRIVKVVAAHDGKGTLSMVSQGLVWMVNAQTPLTWSIGPKRYRRKNGPAPDSQLQPIRGEGLKVTRTAVIVQKTPTAINSHKREVSTECEWAEVSTTMETAENDSKGDTTRLEPSRSRSTW
jgi:hypothetical protein